MLIKNSKYMHFKKPVVLSPAIVTLLLFGPTLLRVKSTHVKTVFLEKDLQVQRCTFPIPSDK